MSSERLDLLIFGASGFTGKFVVLEMMKIVKEKRNLTWGIAGRSVSKLQKLLKSISDETGEDVTNTTTIIADVNSEQSLQEMASKTKVLLNCCGPYRFFGEPVINACIANGTHHLDISGEPQYMERMEVEYNDKAAEKGVYVVSACGFDSIPTEIGISHFLKEFAGDVEYIEAFLKVGSKVKGTGIHYGTWESAVYGLTHADELGALRRKLFSHRLPGVPDKQKKSVIHKSSISNGWCLPFPGADRSVVQRSQRLFLEKQQQRPVPMQMFVSFSSLFVTLVVSFVGLIFALMTKTAFTRKLLLKHPRFFSFGFSSHDGPTEELRNSTVFSVTFFGEGWSGPKLNEGHNSPTDKTLMTKVSGRDPGYGFTATALILAGITVLNESDKMPGVGGVLPPGFAFANTSLHTELSSHGLKFETINLKPVD